MILNCILSYSGFSRLAEWWALVHFQPFQEQSSFRAQSEEFLNEAVTSHLRLRSRQRSTGVVFFALTGRRY